MDETEGKHSQVGYGTILFIQSYYLYDILTTRFGINAIVYSQLLSKKVIILIRYKT